MIENVSVVSQAHTYTCSKQEILSLIALGVVKFAIYNCFVNVRVSVLGGERESQKEREGRMRQAEETVVTDGERLLLALQVLVTEICESAFHPCLCIPKCTLISL